MSRGWAALAMLSPALAAEGWYRNYLCFDGFRHEGGVQVEFRERHHMISNGEPYEGSFSKNNCIQINAGRRNTKDPAKMFKDGHIKGSNVIATETKGQFRKLPERLNFVVSGTFTFTFQGKSKSCDLMVGQGQYSDGGFWSSDVLNWWLGSEDCEGTNRARGELNCPKCGLSFSEKGNDNHFEVVALDDVPELAAASGKSLGLSWSDCGDEETHGKVTKLSTDHLTLGQKETVTGSGTVDEAVASGSFAIDLSAGPISEHWTGDLCAPKAFKLPLFAGSVTWDGLKCPLAKGDTEVSTDIQLSSLLPSSLTKSSIKITATDSSNGKLLCLSLETAPSAVVV